LARRQRKGFDFAHREYLSPAGSAAFPMFRWFTALLGIIPLLHAAPAVSRPNVLIVLIDDHPSNFTDVYQKSHVATPNMQRIAARGTWFSRAYNDAPICCASRTAVLTGVHATRSGVYYNNQAYRRTPEFISRVTTLPAHFRANGYLTVGYGKIPHNSFVADDIGDYTPGYYKYLNNPKDVTHPEDELMQHILPGSLHAIPGKAAVNWAWGILPDDWDRDDPTKLQQDTEQANRTIAVLREAHDQPFFMICGFYRPHGPWTVAQRYYDKFPLETMQIPAGYRADDLEDLPKPGRWIATNRGEHAEVVAAGMWKKCIQAISASTAYIDDQIGRVLDALEQGPNRGNTIVIFADDNGFHTGEKNHWLKFALWEQTNRVVFAISAPGMPRQQVMAPVSLIDIYPTLLSLCQLPPPGTHQLDGLDISGIVAGRKQARGEPVLSTYGRGNHSLRNDRYRYIHYRNGDEELYDDQADPYEWTNLAADPHYAAVKADLGKWLPKIEAPDIVKPLPALLHATWEDAAFEK
jgi:arylsulfatase A-like enzyme